MSEGTTHHTSCSKRRSWFQADIAKRHTNTFNLHLVLKCSCVQCPYSTPNHHAHHHLRPWDQPTKECMWEDTWLCNGFFCPLGTLKRPFVSTISSSTQPFIKNKQWTQLHTHPSNDWGFTSKTSKWIPTYFCITSVKLTINPWSQWLAQWIIKFTSSTSLTFLITSWPSVEH